MNRRRIGIRTARTLGTTIALMAGTAAVAHATESDHQAPDLGGDAWSDPAPEDVPGADVQVEAAPEYVEPAPVEYVEPAPVEYVEPAPVEYVEPAPVEYVEPAPVEYVEPAPVEYVEPAPVEYVEPAPVEYVEPAPVEYVEPAPVEHAEPAPVEHVEPAPVEYVEPAPVEHVEPAPVEYVDPAPVEHVEPVSVDPGAVEQHVDPAPVQHVQPATENVAPTTVQPVQQVDPAPLRPMRPEVAHEYDLSPDAVQAVADGVDVGGLQEIVRITPVDSLTCGEGVLSKNGPILNGVPDALEVCGAVIGQATRGGIGHAAGTVVDTTVRGIGRGATTHDPAPGGTGSDGVVVDAGVPPVDDAVGQVVEDVIGTADDRAVVDEPVDDEPVVETAEEVREEATDRARSDRGRSGRGSGPHGLPTPEEFFSASWWEDIFTPDHGSGSRRDDSGSESAGRGGRGEKPKAEPEQKPEDTKSEEKTSEERTSETHRPISWTGGMSASVAVGPRPARTTVERSDDADRVDEAPEVEDTETTRERARSTTTARPTLASTIQAILSPAPERTAAPRASEAPARAAATPAAARPAESTPTRASTTRTAERTSERATAAPTPAEEVETPQAPSSAQTATATPVPVPTSAVTPSALATTPPPAQPERPATPPTRTPFTHRPVPAESPAQVPAPLPSRRYDRIPSAGSPATAAPRGPVLPRRAAEREWPSGLYLDSADDLTLAEERGRAADVYVVPVDGASWESITAVTTPVPLPTGPERLVLSTPLVPETGTTWAQCAMGEYETHWTQFGAKLAALPAAPIVDLGPAMNEMSAEEVSPAAYAACFAEVSRTIKKAAPEVAIQWTPVLGDQAGMSGDDVLSAWPGRAYVDVIGIDARARGLTWSQTVNGEYGLNYWASFADRQGKRIAVTRWGVHPETPTDRGVNEAYVRHVHDWIATIAAKAALAYEAYSETEDTPSDAAAAYRDLY